MLQILGSSPGLISVGLIPGLLARVTGIRALMAVGPGAVMIGTGLGVALWFPRCLLHVLSLLPGGVGDNLRRLLGLDLHIHWC